MGMYNYFIAEAKCRLCKRKSKIEFQANAGILELKEFQIGDKLLNKPLAEYRGIIAPNKIVFEQNEDFWTIGLGVCPICQSDVWAKIIIKNIKFSEAAVIATPDNIFDWGIIPKD